MYQPSYHAPPGPEAMLDLVAATALATMVTVVDGSAVIDHLPFVLDRRRGPLGTLEAHVASANPVWQHLEAGAPVTVVFQGPAHYLSPAWYPTKQATGRVVPTWNYLAVHARGTARLVRDAERLLPMLERLIAANEGPLHGGDHWKAADAPAGYLAPMLKAIVGFEIEIAGLDGRWKLAQDEALPDRHGAVSGLQSLGDPRARAMGDLIQSTLP
ncbi:FMN-binding negative transcriptional regulator [Roseateles sp.]|uniref:FMN-binding negative transcriptional regulator n=1 Tax=Roseateles sp. TaxID=1971397 RepID=UPI0025E8D57F|nr:FMN-binding negative transcriptional regulator [Roseateles sp.]MBV8034273.1 FMN-binding negative transcriptional regulator [Roseateles sp.]